MESASQNPRMVLGIDGGGSKTAALIASLDESGELNILGHGRGGPSNLRLAGGVACSNRIFHAELISSLSRLAPAPEPVHLVAEPVNGCLKIARSRLLRPQTQS
jgi:hypothetical protein